ncbi:MAG: hypothetical protein WCG93_07365 [Paludibacter sp.]
MGVGLVIGIFILLLFIISVPFIYFFLKKKGKPKLGIIISSLIILFVLSQLFTNEIDEYLFFKSSAKDNLKLAHIELKDDFKIIDNKVTGMPERTQKTKLEISENDKKRIINEIKYSKSYNHINYGGILQQLLKTHNNMNRIIYTNYFCQGKYCRESFYRDNEYIPVLITVILSDENNIIEIERVED